MNLFITIWHETRENRCVHKEGADRLPAILAIHPHAKPKGLANIRLAFYVALLLVG